MDEQFGGVPDDDFVGGAGELQLGALLLGGGQLLAEVGLLLAGDVVGHGFGHGLLGPLAPFPLDGFDALVESFGSFFDGCGVSGELAEQVVAQCLGLSGRESFEAPLPDDEVLDGFVGQVGERAAGLVGVPPDAGPVAVLFTGPAAAEHVDQFRAAQVAVDRPGQVVLTAIRAFTRLTMRGEHFLYPLEDFWHYKSGVLAVVLDALPGDDAHVVGVTQHQHQLLGVQWLGQTLAGGPFGQAAQCQFPGEPVQAPVAGGVGFKRPADQRRTVRVEDHGAAFYAVDDDWGVEVADRGHHRRAAGEHLLLGALDDFGSQVVGVEGSQAAEDGVH